MRNNEVVDAAVTRLEAAGLLAETAGVSFARLEGVDTAVVGIPLVAPTSTLPRVRAVLKGLAHECVITPHPSLGAVYPRTATRDGRTWRIGSQDDVSWINDAVEMGPTITSAIPPRYEAYATVVQHDDAVASGAAESRLLRLLVEHTADQPWWLGYLDTGAHDVVFDDVSKVIVYTGWSYVLVEAGPDEARRWREHDAWRGRLPDLLFPMDHSWLVSMLWDDDWRCLGGPTELVRAVVDDPGLDSRLVRPDEDATPPGHVMY